MSDDLGPFPGILIFILLLAASFICSAFREAMSGLSETDLRQDEAGGNGREETETDTDERGVRVRKKLADILEDPQNMIRASAFWQIVTAACGFAVLNRIAGAGVGLSVLCTVFFTYVFGWALPVSVGKVHGAGFLCGIYSVWRILCAASVPFTAVFGWAALGLGKLLKSDPSLVRDEVTEDEIISMVNEGHEQGTVDEDEAKMIRNIFELDEKQAQDIMTVRGKILALRGDTILDDAIRRMVNSPNSRYPVYEDTIDNILGALYLKDAMSFHMKEQYNQKPIREIPGLLRRVEFVPETRRIDELFTDMQKTQKQIAIVVDEYGETAGLVTMEDILEEIVGNIFDEYDRVERTIVPIGRGKWRISGMAPLSDAAKTLGIQEHEDYETLNGYLTAMLDHVPGPDDVGRTVEDEKNGILYTVRSVHGNTIQWASAEKKQKPEEDQNQAPSGPEELRIRKGRNRERSETDPVRTREG